MNSWFFQQKFVYQKQKIMKHVLVLIFSLFIYLLASAQEITQTVKGVVIDKISEKPLQGATITLLDSKIASVSDGEGKFVLNNVPVGRVKISVTYNGYKEVVVPELLVTAGKEVILDISLEQNIKEVSEIIIKGSRVKKGAATNEYATASARSFNVEEVTRFAGGRNDPAKLVSNFAGVVANSDARNDIVVRGNSPAGVLWRIEGIPAPSPNHFSTLGTTGGPISALNTNALKTSDFYTGAFPAEFGNANAAVFDIQLRSGNTDKHERTFQLNAFSGLELMLEGPLSKKRNGSSYLFGYRYSFVQIGGNLGLNVGTEAIPRYQDFVYNIQFAKGKAGKLNLFGMGGFSGIDFIGKELDTTDFFGRQDQDAFNKSNFLTVGAKHTIDVGKKSYIRTVATYSNQRVDFDQFQYPLPVPPYNNSWKITDVRDRNRTLRISSFINTKVNSKFSWRGGVTAEFFNLETKVLDKEGLPEAAPFRIVRDLNDNFNLFQYFAQGRYQFNEKISVTGGLHGMYFDFNKTSILEPRAAITYKINSTNSLYFSYGLHGQLQPFPVYLFETLPNGTTNKNNRNLDFTKANHYVLGYERRMRNDWRIKTELYYQNLTGVPVDAYASGFSMLNAGGDFAFPERAGLVNEGTGTNTGAELTIEKFLSKGLYLLTSVSLFESKYKGSDGIERNTTFNYGYVANILGGYEYKIGKNKRNALTVDVRFSTIGGRYATPVNVAASQAARREILDETKFNSEQLSNYLRLDTKFGFRLNSKKRKVSQTFYFDMQNLTNRQNIFLRRFNAEKGTVGNVYQIGFFPDVLYRIQF
jgi:Carboxypeptidase regulatory-like domain/TonB-dependent Receptor Plug Domain